MTFCIENSFYRRISSYFLFIFYFFFVFLVCEKSKSSNTLLLDYIVCDEKGKRRLALCVTVSVITAPGLSSSYSSSSAAVVTTVVAATKLATMVAVAANQSKKSVELINRLFLFGFCQFLHPLQSIYELFEFISAFFVILKHSPACTSR